MPRCFDEPHFLNASVRCTPMFLRCPLRNNFFDRWFESFRRSLCVEWICVCLPDNYRPTVATHSKPVPNRRRRYAKAWLPRGPPLRSGARTPPGHLLPSKRRELPPPTAGESGSATSPMETKMQNVPVIEASLLVVGRWGADRLISQTER